MIGFILLFILVLFLLASSANTGAVDEFSSAKYQKTIKYPMTTNKSSEEYGFYKGEPHHNRLQTQDDIDQYNLYGYNIDQFSKGSDHDQVTWDRSVGGIYGEAFKALDNQYILDRAYETDKFKVPTDQLPMQWYDNPFYFSNPVYNTQSFPNHY